MEVLRYEVQFDGQAFAALRLDRLLQRRGVGGGPGRQHDQEALFSEFLGDGTADTPADADGQIAVVDSLSMR